MKQVWSKTLAVLLIAALLLPTGAFAARREDDALPAVPSGEETAVSLTAQPVEDVPAELSKIADDEWKIFPLITQDNEITRNPDPEAPAAWGAVPDDAQLYYHSQEMSAFIHFGVNTYTGAEWGSGTEDPKVFNPTAMTTQEEADAVAEEWVRAFQAGGFKRLVLVGKHHDGFCIWPSQYTKRDTDSSRVPGVDIVWAVSKACTKYNMDMGFYLSPWDESAESYGYRDAAGDGITKEQEDALIADGTLDELMDYNKYYDAQLREILGNKKYGNNGKFVEIWMDGAKGTGSMAQEYDFNKWFRTIKELQPDARCFDGNAGSGIRWCGNETGLSGDETCWQKMDVDSNGKLTPQKDTHGAVVYAKGRSNGAVWSISECDVSMHNGWFNGPPRSFESLIDMYYNSVGHGAVWLLNVPPYKSVSGVRTGEFSEADIAQLQRIGTALAETYETNFAAASNGATATTTQGTERTSAKQGKFAAAQVLDEDNDTYWTLQDGQTSGQITIDLGQSRVFDLISIREYIPLGQRIAQTKIEYSPDGETWMTFRETTTVGPRRLVVDKPVAGRYVRITVTVTEECDDVPLLSSVGVYKACADMERTGAVKIPDEAVFKDERDSMFNYTGSWTNYDNADGKEDTHKGSGTAGNNVTFNFTGSRFYVTGIKDPNHGPVEVTVDGTVLGTFNTQAGMRSTQEVLYVSPCLSYGSHSVKLTVKTGGGKTYFDFDGVYILEGRNGILEFSKTVYPVRQDGKVKVKIRRAGGTEGTVSFKVIDLPGTAVSGQYYKVVDEDITFEEGESEATIEVTTMPKSGGKEFYLQIVEITGGALAGEVSTTMRIVDDETPFNVEPEGETFTAEDPFQMPAKAGQTNKMEAEYMVLDGSQRVNQNQTAICIGDGGSGKFVNWFNNGNKAYLYYNAPRAGTYTMTMQYNSGRSGTTNLNTVNWRGDKVTNREESVPGTSGFTTTQFQFVVEEPGPGCIEFYANAQDSPQIDWFTFTLVTPKAIPATDVTVTPAEVTIYTNEDDPAHTAQLTADIAPEDAEAEYYTLAWRSSDSGVANYDQTGKITGLSNGEATITATVTNQDGTKVVGEAAVTVKTKVTGSVIITGEPKYEATLLAAVNQISHQGAKAGLTYQWNRDGQPISGANDPTYTLAAEDVGHEITVTVTASGYYEGTRTSDPVTGTPADGPEVVATLDYEDCTEVGNDGKITGLNPARKYQYKLVSAGEEAWEDIPGTPGVTELTGLAHGSYHVRVAATEIDSTVVKTAGPASRTLTILAYSAPGHDVNIETLTNGRVTASVRRAARGEKVVLTAYPATGYQLKEGSLKVTAVSGPVTVGADNSFTMPDGEVTVTAEFETRVYTITHNLTHINCTMTEHDHKAEHGSKPVVTLSPELGFDLPQTIAFTETDGGAAFNGYTYLNGVITFTQGIESDLTVRGEGVQKSYPVTYEFTQLSATVAPRTTGHGDELTFTITPAEGYTLPETISITVNGTPLEADDYEYGAGNVTIKAGKITGNVVITAEGVRQTAELLGVTVEGTAQEGQRLWATPDPADATVVYQWIRVDEDGGETEIPGAVYRGYMLTDEDVGCTVKVRATGTGGFGGSPESQPTAAVTATPKPSTSTSKPSTITETKTEPDGTKVTTVTDKRTGTVTETTEKPDGTTEIVETKKDGTVTETVTDPEGAKTEKVTTPDEAVTITVTDPEGEEVAKIELPAEIPEPEEPFVDVDGVNWAKEAINSVAGLGIVKGVGDQKYDPIAPMTRGSLATVLHRLSQGKTDYEVAFKDVAKDTYYTEGVAWAAKVKVVTGYTPETFAPDDIITREQLAVMLARYAKLIGMDTTADKEVLDEFVDGGKTGPWAVDGMAWAVKNGILKGKGANDLDPTANVSRAEVAVMLDRFLKLVK